MKKPLSISEKLRIRSFYGIDDLTVSCNLIKETKTLGDWNLRLGPEINTESICTIIKSSLKNLGIRVVDPLEQVTPSRPLLSATIHYRSVLEKLGEVFIIGFFVQLQLQQQIVIAKESLNLQKDRNWLPAVTWSRETLSAVEPENEPPIKEVLLEKLLDLVDEFANDFLTANPPEPRSDQGGE